MKDRLKTLAIPCAFVLIAPLAAACHFDDDAGEGGCQPDTPGLEGRLIFDFMMTDEDVSQPNGKAFAAGTEAHMNIRPVNEEEPLPAWTIESDDESVITVDDILPEGSFPVVLGMREPGHTEISVLEDEVPNAFAFVRPPGAVTSLRPGSGLSQNPAWRSTGLSKASRSSTSPTSLPTTFIGPGIRYGGAWPTNTEPAQRSGSH